MMRGRFLVTLLGGGGEATAGASDVEELDDESPELDRPLLDSDSDELALAAGGGAFGEADETVSDSESSEVSSDEEALGEGDDGRGFFVWIRLFLVVGGGAVTRARAFGGIEGPAEEFEDDSEDDEVDLESDRAIARFVFGRCRGRADDADEDEPEPESESEEDSEEESSDEDDSKLDSSPRTVLTIVVFIVLLDRALSIRGGSLALALVLAGAKRSGAEPDPAAPAPERRMHRTLGLASSRSKISSSDDDSASDEDDEDDDEDDGNSADVVVSSAIHGIDLGFALSDRRFKGGLDVDVVFEVGFGLGLG